MKTVKKLFPLLRIYRGQLIGVIVLGSIMSICQGIVAPLFAFLFDTVFSTPVQGAAAIPTAGSEHLSFFYEFLYGVFGKDKATLVKVIPFCFIFLYFINGWSRYFHFFLIRMVGEKVSVRIRQQLQEKYLSLSQTFHHDYQGGSGGLLSRTLNDVLVLQNGIYLFADFFREPLLALILLVNLFLLDWKLTLFVLIVAPVLALVLNQIGRGLRKYGHRSQTSLESLTSTLKESLDGVKIIQSYGLVDKMKQRLSGDVNQYLDMRKKVIGNEELAGPASELIGSILFSSLCFYVGRGVIEGTSSAGVFVGFIVALGFMQKPIKKLQDAFVKIQQILVVTERIFSVLDNDNHVPELKNPKPFPEDWKKVEFRNLEFSFGNERILKNVNFTVNRGEVIAIVGESGSGKTTLMNLLERFFDPASGNILIGDIPITDFKLETLRANIALVTQEVFLFNDTVRQNIQFGDLSKPNGDVEQAARLANATKFIEKFPGGFNYNVGERGQRLSGGEKQRVSIARAIFRNSPILILDEATSALDSISEIEVQKGLEQLMKGRTCFVIAHRLSTIMKADRILVFQKGTIIADGKHDELLVKGGEYFKYYQIQTQGQAH